MYSGRDNPAYTDRLQVMDAFKLQASTFNPKTRPVVPREQFPTTSKPLWKCRRFQRIANFCESLQ